MDYCRPRSAEELDAIMRHDQTEHDKQLKAVLDGEVVSDGTLTPILIPEWDADEAVQKTIDVAFEDITEEMRGSQDG